MNKDRNDLAPPRAEDVLAALPVGVFLTDSAGRITWVNDTLCDQLGVPRERMLGVAHNALPARKTLSLSKTVQWLHVPGASAQGPVERRFECITQKLDDADGCMGCVIEVSRYEVSPRRPRPLYPEMKDPGRLDSSTGLLNTQTMQQELIAQVSRSRRYLNPLSVVMIRLQDMEEIAGGVAGIQKQRLIRGIAKMLKEKLRWVDVVGCWDKDAFMLILPETSQDAAGKLVRKLQTYIHRMLAEEERTGSNSVVIDIGLAEWTKGDDLNSLLARVERDLRGDRDDRAQDAP